MDREIKDKESDEEYDEILDNTFFHKYHCIERLGKGSFGSIYKAECDNEFYALKFESIKNGQNLLENEAAIMDYLKGPNIPYVKLYGTTSKYNILVMQLLGKSLENIFNERKIFSIKTVCMLGSQIVSILEYIHNRHILHRDIKPDNFVMGINDLCQYVYILDFGLAKKYRSSTTLKQYPLFYRKVLTGTARYASINALRGLEHSRRDDLEAAGYMLMYFLRGSLPWQGLQAKTKEERYKKILEKKVEISSKNLCEGFPYEFEKYVEYTKNMEYLDPPDYEMLRGLFSHVIRKMNCKFDYIYDWTTPEERMMHRVCTSKSDLGSSNNKITITSNKRTTIFTNKNNGDDNKNEDEKINYYDYSLLTLNNNNKNSTKNIFGINFNKKNNKSFLKNFEEDNQIKEIFNDEESIKKKRQNSENENNVNKMKDKDDICCSSGCFIF